MPRHPTEYGNLLKALIAKHGVQCWLVNTGWTGGAYGTGSRMPIRQTRAMLTEALSGRLVDAEFRTDQNFGFDVPVAIPGVEAAILNPRGTWADPEAYDAQAKKLVGMFVANFAKFDTHVDEGGARRSARRSGPQPDRKRFRFRGEGRMKYRGQLKAPGYFSACALCHQDSSTWGRPSEVFDGERPVSSTVQLMRWRKAEKLSKVTTSTGLRSNFSVS